jgi:hypothetical protein
MVALLVDDKPWHRPISYALSLGNVSSWQVRLGAQGGCDNFHATPVGGCSYQNCKYKDGSILFVSVKSVLFSIMQITATRLNIWHYKSNVLFNTVLYNCSSQLADPGGLEFTKSDIKTLA